MDIEQEIIKNDIVIRVADAREYFKGCIPGWKTFAENFGYDWKDVVRHGLKASELYATNDAMARNLVRFVYERNIIV